MSECRGTIVLHEKMGEPRKRVRDQQRRKNQPGSPQNDGQRQNAPSRHRTYGMKNAGQQPAVRYNVQRPELFERPWLIHVRILTPGVMTTIATKTPLSRPI